MRRRGWAVCTLVATVAIACDPTRAEEPVELYVPSYDGTYIGAGLRKPPGEGPFPAVLFIHGGLGGSGVRAMKSFTRQVVPDHFYKLGYVVMSTDYRRYHFGEDEIQDVLAAYELLRRYPSVDPDRVAVVGGSHGGYLTMMLTTRVRPAAAVSFAGLSDIDGMYFDRAQQTRQSLSGYDDWKQRLFANRTVGARAERAEAHDRGAAGRDERPGSTAAARPPGPGFEISLDLAWRFGDRRELYRAISPKYNVDKMAGPLLYLVGGEDHLKTAGRAVVDALKARGVTAEYSEHEGIGHGFYWGARDPQSQPPQQFHDALKVTTEFIDRHLRKPAPAGQ